jgi:hypothetical protein
MDMKYSPSTGGFYTYEIHGNNMPGDVVDVPDDTYLALIEGQSQGKQISPGADGVPELIDPPVQAKPDVTVVTMRQARLALLAAGKLTEVTDAIAALDEPERSRAQIEWEFASDVEKSSPLIQSLAASVGLDDAALTALFNTAATL